MMRRKDIWTLPRTGGLLCALLWFALAANRLQACVDGIPHQWNLVGSERIASEAGVYAFADVCTRWREKMAAELQPLGLASAPLAIVGLFGPDPATPVPVSLRNSFAEAVPLAWPASAAALELKPGVSLADHDSLMNCASETPATLLAVVQIRDGYREATRSVDQLSSLWSGIRLQVKEYALIGVKVITRSGDTVFLDEFEEAPTASVDLAFTPLGGFVRRLEQLNSKPRAIFFYRVATDTSALLIQDTFPPADGLPPLTNYKPPLEGLAIYSGQTIIPAGGDATGTHRIVVPAPTSCTCGGGATP